MGSEWRGITLREQQGWGAGCFWLLGPGAGAAKKLASSSALLENKKHKEIVLLFTFLR